MLVQLLTTYHLILTTYIVLASQKSPYFCSAMKKASFLSRLQQPIALEIDKVHIFKVAALGGLIVTVFLYLFRPFGTQVEPGGALVFLAVCLGFGLVTFCMVLIWLPLSWLFPRWFEEQRWVLWKEITMNVLVVGTIGMGNLLYMHWIAHTPLTFMAFWRWQVLTFAVGTIPSMGIALFRQWKAQERYSRKAADWSHHIEERLEKGNQAVERTDMVRLQGDNQGEQLSVPVGKIRCVEAADNYVQVFFEENGQIKSKMLRSTLKKTEDTLNAYPGFFRCHRTFLVQLAHVKHVSGNAQGYRLHLDGMEALIPVSRKQNEAIAQKFEV